MNLLFSCVGQRGYMADFFRPQLSENDRIIGTGNTRWTPGFARCDSSFLLPDIDNPGYLDAVVELCQHQRIDAVLSFNDLDVVTLASAHERFRAINTKLILPAAEIAGILFDKYKTYEFLRSNNVATPRTALHPDSARDFDFPLYVKPRRGSGSLDTFVAKNELDLAVFFAYRPDMIIQEVATGEPINIELCTGFDGVPVGISVWRKFKSRLGETEQAETVNDPDIVDFGLRIGRLLKATGPMDIDAFRGDDGIVVLEVNTRFGGGYPVSHLAGADFPRKLMNILREGTTEPDYSFRGDVVMMKRLEIIGGPAPDFFTKELKISE